MRSTFDGYNNIIIHRDIGKFALVEYVKDKWYSGDGKVFSVRLGVYGEDFWNFSTIEAATVCFECCQRTYDENCDKLDMSQILDLVMLDPQLNAKIKEIEK